MIANRKLGKARRVLDGVAGWVLLALAAGMILLVIALMGCAEKQTRIALISAKETKKAETRIALIGPKETKAAGIEDSGSRIEGVQAAAVKRYTNPPPVPVTNLTLVWTSQWPVVELQVAPKVEGPWISYARQTNWNWTYPRAWTQTVAVTSGAAYFRAAELCLLNLH